MTAAWSVDEVVCWFCLDHVNHSGKSNLIADIWWKLDPNNTHLENKIGISEYIEHFQFCELRLQPEVNYGFELSCNQSRHDW